MLTKADACWKHVVPKLQGAGWDNGPHSVTGCRSTEFVLSEFTALPPMFHLGKVNEIIGKFGGPDQLRTAVNQLQSLLCAASRIPSNKPWYLGFFGERYVAEWLEPLKADGWFIFHDVPCVGASGNFNLDHVAIGPGGVWVVETKTRRKGRARPGMKEHEVIFDGAKIIWPWWDDTDSLKQATDNVRWLHDWLEKMTGKAFDVAGVLAFPGYYVIERKLGSVRVTNPKALPQVLTSRGKSVLSEDDVDLVRRQLESKCRDVEY